MSQPHHCRLHLSASARVCNEACGRSARSRTDSAQELALLSAPSAQTATPGRFSLCALYSSHKEVSKFGLKRSLSEVYVSLYLYVQEPRLQAGSGIAQVFRTGPLAGFFDLKQATHCEP